MDDNQTREAVKKAYPSRQWKDKVDNMRPDQVTAIYIRLQAQRKL
jgi:hypothetical protein